MRRHAIGLVGLVLSSVLGIGLIRASDYVVTDAKQSLPRADAATDGRCMAAAVRTQRQSDARATTRPTFTCDAQLVAFDPDGFGSCGIFAFYQRARYDIIRVVEGECDAREIVVDHLACEADVFDGFAIGDRVRVTVELRLDHSSGISYRGSCDDALTPSVVLVSVNGPTKLEHCDVVAPSN